MSHDSRLQERKEIVNYEDIATCLRVEHMQESRCSHNEAMTILDGLCGLRFRVIYAYEKCRYDLDT